MTPSDPDAAAREGGSEGPPRDGGKVALVLSGGGARGAYEAGVLRYLREELPQRLGYHPRIDVVSGTSVGAINAAFFAATADDPVEQSKRLCREWSGLRVDQMVQLGLRDVMRATRLLLGAEPPPPQPGELRRGGMLNTAGLERLVVRSVPWRKIAANIAAGHLEALSVSATHVATGRTVVFIERRGGAIPEWSRDPRVVARATHVGPQHVLASAAIPALFPAVAVDGAYYSDGGLRQNTPLSPALRLGADRLLVISLKHLRTEEELRRDEAATVEAFPSPWFLVGKSLNALLLDHTDYDISRMRRMNAILEGGIEAFGERFLPELNRTLLRIRGQAVKPVHPLLIRPSRDIGEIAGQHARSSRMKALPGLQGRVLRYLASATGPLIEADLLSYLLFDGQFAAELIQLGHDDARAREEELAAFFGERPRAAGSGSGAA